MGEGRNGSRLGWEAVPGLGTPGFAAKALISCHNPCPFTLHPPSFIQFLLIKPKIAAMGLNPQPK